MPEHETQSHKNKIPITKEAQSTVLHAIFGAAAGWVSFYADRVLHIGGELSVVTGLAILVALLYASSLITHKLFPGHDQKWWAGNGAIVFVLMWFVVGTLMTTL